MRELLARYYYAYGNTKIPMLNAAIGMVVNITLNLTLSRVIGIGGLALATSVAAIVTVILMWCQCRRLSSDSKIILNWIEIGKILIAAIVMGGGVQLGQKLILQSGILKLAILIFIGIISYGTMILLLRVKIAKELLDKARKKNR